ncbi:MAG: 2-dehydropantoate 2-reductase N-terminal domain-containing protein [Christensenellaceae bacterium]|jgi:mannitol-1-phosphate 5-dehydrogenase
MLQITIIGAGKAGRGFIARLLNEQVKLTFLDKNEALIDALNAAGSYQVRFFGGAKTVIVKDYVAYHIDTPAAVEAIQKSDAVFVSVGGENTPLVGAWLKDKIDEKTPVLACENALLPSSLMGPLKETAISGAVFCTTIEDGLLNIASENYPVLHVAQQGLPAEIDALEGISSTDNFPLLMLRKIYTYNAASAIIAYMGAYKGYELYADAANDAFISRLTGGFYREIDLAISLEYGVPLEAQNSFSAMADAKFKSKEIVDTIARNAASPARKLGPEERIIAPSRLIFAHGGDPTPLLLAGAAALLYMNIETVEAAQQALETYSKLTSDDPLMQQILFHFSRLLEEKA